MIRKSDKLVEATMLALQGKLELKENRVSRKTKKSEGIDVNVDDNTTVSVEGNETIVDTQDATVIVNKKEDEFIPETSDDVPMEAPVEEPTVDAPVAPDDDMVEVPADDTVMPEEVVDEPVDTELPTEESRKFESVEIEVSDDGKEVEVTTDNGEEVEVKDETPEENEDGEVEDTETEIPADDEPSIDEMIEESKKVTETQDLKIFDILNDEDTQTLHRDIDMIVDDIDNHMIRPATIKSAEALFSNLEYMFTKMNPEYKYTQSYIKNECDKKVEDTEEYLQPRYDSRASFYKKAKVVTKDNGDEELYSYGTHVGGVRGGKPYSKGRFSQTTSRHQKEFFKQRGVDPNKVDVEEGKQADRNEEEIEAKKCSNCIKHENKARSKKVQEMIARRQRKSEALNKLNTTVARHRKVMEVNKLRQAKKVESVEAKNDLGINEEIPKKEEPVPNTATASLKNESKFSSKTFNNVLSQFYGEKFKTVENVNVTKISRTRAGLKIEANLISKSGKLKRAICLEAKRIQTGKSFDKYEIVETKGLVKENKSNSTKITMTTFTNKQNVIECRYILCK